VRLKAALIVGAATLAGCGGSTKTVTVSRVILDTEKVERSIEQSILAQRHFRAVVSCPSGVHQGKGLTFECVATLANGRKTRFRVSQRDGRGAVTYVGL
jgi:hypothetical protein